MPYPFSTPKVTILNGQSLSNAVQVGAAQLAAVEMPAAWDAAGMTFQASVDGINFFNLKDDTGAEISLVVAAATHVGLGEGSTAKTEQFRGAPYLKVRSGTGASPVNQTADRIITL